MIAFIFSIQRVFQLFNQYPIIQFVIKKLKMFPYQNFQIIFNPIDTYGGQMIPICDFPSIYIQLHHQDHNSYPFPFLQQNLCFGQFYQSTHFTNQNLFNSGSIMVENATLTENNKTSKCDSSTKFEQNAINESKIRPKTKHISKKTHEKSSNQVENQQKNKKISNLQKKNESQYSVEQDSRKKSEEHHHLYLKYRRKNTESNIVNRIFSYLTTEFKNKKEILRLELTEEKKQSYLKCHTLVNDAWRGPAKRQLLKSLMFPDIPLPGFKPISKICGNQEVLSIQQFSYLNRILIKTYLSKIASISVITSKKMKKTVWKQHLQKIRELKEYFFNSSEPGLEY